MSDYEFMPKTSSNTLLTTTLLVLTFYRSTLQCHRVDAG